MISLSNQHIVVVGGSSGIGLEVARLAVEQGAKVTIMGRSRERLDAAALTLESVQTVALDIAHEAAVKQAFTSIAVPNHVYVSAASFVGGSILDGNLVDFRQALEARLWGSVNVVRAVAKSMLEPGSSFVFTGGLSTDRPVKGAWATAVATAAAEQLARSLALELAPLRFNAIAPGWTDTPMWDGILGDTKAQTFEAIGSQIPVGRIASVSDVAHAVITLMANSFINGEVLHVDGGHRLV
jgi:NAD(P)-dependent dehydrogenase (short-subunit alcohol dehydrogenase family)